MAAGGYGASLGDVLWARCRRTLEILYRPDLVEIIPLPPPSDEGMRAPIWPGAYDDQPEEDEEEEVDLAELVGPLTSGGELVSGDMEHRPSQETMAREVAAALVNSEKLMVEAPTGTGKTLAYLIPACRLTDALGAQVLISTYTKALQDQVCLTLLDISEWMAPVRWTVLKGLGNYLSVNALAEELALVDPLDSGQLRDNPLFPDQASEPLSDQSPRPGLGGDLGLGGGDAHRRVGRPSRRMAQETQPGYVPAPFPAVDDRVPGQSPR